MGDDTRPVEMNYSVMIKQTSPDTTTVTMARKREKRETLE